MSAVSYDEDRGAGETAPGVRMLKAVWGIDESEERRSPETVVPVSSDIYQVPPLKTPFPRRLARPVR
jgi:hypothetical protein